jgi:hypothetical protein
MLDRVYAHMLKLSNHAWRRLLLRISRRVQKDTARV